MERTAGAALGTQALAFLGALTGVTGALALLGLLLWLGYSGELPWRRPSGPWSGTIDLGWLLLFAVQHSGMARASFKRWCRSVLPVPLERPLYLAASGLISLGLVLTWQPIAGEPWWHGPKWLTSIAILASFGVGLTAMRQGATSFLGLRDDADSTAGPLLVSGPYRFVRHPMMAGTLVLLWVHPVMTPTLALLSGGLSLYVLLGTWLEERDLLRRFGAAYRAYRQRVPALLPWRRPAPAASYPAERD